MKHCHPAVAPLRWSLLTALLVAAVLLHGSGLRLAAADEPLYSVTLAWDANPEPDVTGYRLHYGTASGTYSSTVDVGNTTTATLTMPGTGTYYAVATAYNSASLESLPSNEVEFTVAPLDEENPLITGIPADIVLKPSAPGGTTATASWVEPVATDNSGIVSLETSHAPGTTFPAGTTVVTYTATDAAGNSASASFTVTVAGFDLWKTAAFGAQADNPAIAGDEMDPDDDRWNNLSEYALGLGALANDGENVFSQSVVSETVTLYFSHNRYLPDVRLSVECCDELGAGWYPVATREPQGEWQGVTSATVSTGLEGDRVSVAITEGIGKRGAGFYRLVVERAGLP